MGWAGIVLSIASALALRPLDTARAVVASSGVLLFAIVAVVSLGAWFARIVNTGPRPTWLTADGTPQVATAAVLVCCCGIATLLLTGSPVVTIGEAILVIGLVAASNRLERLDRNRPRAQPTWLRWAAVPGIAMTGVLVVQVMT